MKVLSIFLALLNTLIAILVLGMSLTGSEVQQATLLWLGTKVLASLMVIAIGVLTWVASARPIKARLIFLSGITLIALGIAAAVWTVHLALVTGDMEYYMVVFGGSLAAQGVASLWDMLATSTDIAMAS